MKKQNNLIYSSASPDEVAADLAPLLQFSNKGLPIEKLSKLLDECLLPHLVKYNSPNFHSLYNCIPEEGAEFGAKIALHHNQGVTNWQVSPGGVMLEELCTRAMCKLFKLKNGSDATFMYSGTYANQQAIYMALHRKAEQLGINLVEDGLSEFSYHNPLAILVSEEAHLSVKQTIRMMGLGEKSIISVPVDQNHCMDINSLQNIVKRIKKTHTIFCILSTAGTTSSGSVDPIKPVYNICEDLDAWFHIDGAYGLSFSIIPEIQHIFDGKELADSICWDPHKQFGVPIPSSMLFVKNRYDFNRMAIFGNYFNRKDDPELNPGLKSPPTTRPFSALPLLTTILYQGWDKLIENLHSPIKAVQEVFKKITDQKDIEILHTPQLGILCFQIKPAGFPEDKLDDLQVFAYEKIKQGGIRSVSMTSLNKQKAIRLVAISPLVTSEAMLESIENIRELANEYKKTI